MDEKMKKKLGDLLRSLPGKGDLELHLDAGDLLNQDDFKRMEKLMESGKFSMNESEAESIAKSTTIGVFTHLIMTKLKEVTDMIEALSKFAETNPELKSIMDQYLTQLRPISQDDRIKNVLDGYAAMIKKTTMSALNRMEGHSPDSYVN